MSLLESAEAAPPALTVTAVFVGGASTTIAANQTAEMDEHQQLGIGWRERCSLPRMRKADTRLPARRTTPAVAVANHRRESNAGVSPLVGIAPVFAKGRTRLLLPVAEH